MANASQDLDLYQNVDEMMQICRSAVSKAIARNRSLGIPNVYTINGERYVEMPDGEMIRQPRESAEADRRD